MPPQCLRFGTNPLLGVERIDQGHRGVLRLTLADPVSERCEKTLYRLYRDVAWDICLTAELLGQVTITRLTPRNSNVIEASIAVR